MWGNTVKFSGEFYLCHKPVILEGLRDAFIYELKILCLEMVSTGGSWKNGISGLTRSAYTLVGTYINWGSC